MLKNGDSLNIDVTIIKDGWFRRYQPHVSRGRALDPSRRLTDITYDCMWKASNRCAMAPRWAISAMPSSSTPRRRGFSVVREFCGYGIGQRFHEDPQVLHYGKPGTGVKLVTGMLFTVEPMINAGRREIRQLADGWTVVTRDHSLSAQWSTRCWSPIPATKC